MKLIGYEFYKISKKRIVLLLSFFLLVINGVFYVYEQYKTNETLIQDLQAYKQQEQKYEGISPEEGWQLTSAQYEQLNLFQQFVQADVFSDDPVWQSFMEELIKEQEDAYQQYLESPYYNHADAIRRDAFINERLKSQFEHALHFQERIMTMEDRAKDMVSVSIFNDKHSFSYRNIVKTVEDFKPLRGLPFQLGLEEGVVTGTNFRPTDLCMAVILLLLASVLFYVEKEEGLVPLIRAARHGKLRTFGAKFTVLTICTIGLSLLYYGSILFLAGRIYGFGDLSRYIQSMSAFDHAVEPLTAGQYLLFYLAAKIIVNVLLAWLITALFVSLGHISRIYIVLTLFIAANFLCYVLIHPNSYMNVLKYINLIAFYDFFHLISDYRNLNILGYPIRKDTLTFVSWGILAIVLPAVSAWFFVRQSGTITRPAPWRWIAGWKAWLWNNKRTNSLIMHEWFKLLIVGKSIFVLLIAFIYMYQHIEQDERRYDVETGTYNHYISILNGKLTDHKLQLIQNELDQFAELPNQLNHLKASLDAGEIDLLTYNQEKYEIERYLNRQRAFQYVIEQRDYLIRLQEHKGITGGFVNTMTSDALFNRKQEQIRDGITYLILLIVGLAPLFSIDVKYGFMSIIWSSSKGRWRMFAIKYIIAYLYAIGLFMLIQFPKYFNVIVHLPSIDWRLPVQSIEVLGHVNWPVSILAYVIITNLLQICGVLMIVHVILMCAVLVRKQMFMLIAATSLTVLPLSLEYFELSMISKYSFNFIFLLYDKFHSVSYETGIGLYFGTLLVIGTAAFWAAWSVINRSEWRVV